MLWSIVRLIKKLTLNSSLDTQRVQVESVSEEIHDQVPLLEPYGLTSFPPSDVNVGIAVFVGGESDAGTCLGFFDQTHRPKDLLPGEVCIYSKFGQKIKLKSDGGVHVSNSSGANIEINPEGKIGLSTSNSVDINTSSLNVTGPTKINGPLECTNSFSAPSASIGGKDFITHAHSGVDTGPYNTGGVV